MSPLKPNANDIVTTAKSRYTTKSYDVTRRINDVDVQVIRELLRFSPSSTNAQPWHFILASTQEGKERIAKSTDGVYIFNRAKIVDASHVVVFAARNEIDEEYLQHILKIEEDDNRFVADPQMLREQMHGARSMFVNMHKDAGDLDAWTQAQTYLNIGQFMLGVAALGIDATPMEGVDLGILDAEFGLKEKGFRSLVVVSLGYRAADDFNAALPKSRLSEAEIITEI
ncbi:NAD(P)H nitroreductase [Sphingorhabdus lutea]|uniref:NAD(P)H nitroreductase n=2 Tax=Sphingorhabdus lutea TaxID=1913578 RepID=A0A1L3J8U8_9SPHN|nr:NAD(P)H nitroreductase [Sphingorhabdus lutea]